MRADRLIAALLFLQSRERVTVDEMAAELEVSRRTARRDLEALVSAGVPVFPQRGRGGGWSLVGGARIELNGLTAAEIRALFLVAGPLSAGSPELRLALRKLIRALPTPLRPAAERASRAVVMDGDGWFGSDAGDPHLTMLRQAVLDGVQARIDNGRGEEQVHPYGLVVDDCGWHLVAGVVDGPRAYRLNDLRSVTVTGTPADRPEDVDLARTWGDLTARTSSRLRARRSALSGLLRIFPGQVRVGRELPGGFVEAEVRGFSAEVLTHRLAGLGAGVEVLDPPQIRRRLASIGAELTALYR